MVIYKSPNLVTGEVGGGFHYVVNTHKPQTLKVVTRRKLEIRQQLNGERTVAELSDRFGTSESVMNSFLRSLEPGEIIQFNDRFSAIKKPPVAQTLNLWIHATNKCNLACSYCYISTLQSSGGMSEAVRQALLNKLLYTVERKKLSLVKLRLAGGEPLLQFKQWKDFIVEAHDKFRNTGCQLQIAFVSNLTLLNDEMIAFAAQYHIEFGVSLDGVAHHHDATRVFHNGKGSFDLIRKGLDQLVSARIPVSTTTVVSDQNMEGLPDLTHYLVGLNIPFRYSIVKGVPVDREKLARYLSESYDIMEEHIGRGWQFSKKHQLCDLSPTQLSTQACASGFSGGAVYNDGQVYFCHVQFGSGAGIAGNVFDNDRDLLEEIEGVAHFEGMRSTDCARCAYKHICSSGCPMYRVNGKDPNCGLYHRFLPRIFQLQGKERLCLIQKHYAS